MTPTTERAALALALFDDLVDLGPAAREARLGAVRVQDPLLAQEVARMFAADARVSGVIDRGLRGLAVTLAPAAEQAQLGAGAEGRRIGPFVLRRLLGRGGMGEVWLGQRVDGDFSQSVALKLLRRGMDSEDLLRRFMQERRILANLSHPGIARFIDGGVGEQGAPWYAMEYVQGVALTEYARGQSLGVRDRVALMAEVAEVVAYAQAHLVVHRDLKPSNILVDADGRVRLLDFGIAKLLQDDLDVGQTATGVRAMSPAYAAPEQILDEAISTATDVYALGAILHELLTASLPHARSATTLETLADSVRHETPQKPSARLRQAETGVAVTLGVRSGVLARFARAVAGELDTIVLTALRREPARRYASAAALADDLRRWLDGRPVAAQPDTSAYRMRKFVGRHRLAVGSASGILLALVAGFGTALWQASVARNAAQRADAEAESSERSANFALAMVREQYAYGRQTTVPRTPQEMLVASIESARTTLKDDDRARAIVLAKLGEIQSVIDSPARAEGAVVEALQITRMLHGDADPETGDALVAAATVKEQGDQLVVAESMLREALQVYTRSPGNDRSIVMTRSRLASILRRTGRIDAAVNELQAARAGAVVAYGADHPNTIELTGNGAMLLEQLDRLDEAEIGFRSAIAGYERIDPDFPRLASPLFNLGLLLARTGRYTEARESTRRALEIVHRQVGPADPQVAIMSLRHAEMLRRIGASEDAERARDAIDIVALRDRPVQYSRLLRLNAQLLCDRGRVAEAMDEFGRAEDVLDGANGDTDEARLGLELGIAEALIASTRWDEAASSVTRVRQRLEKATPLAAEFHVDMAWIEARLAAHAGAVEEAAVLLEGAIRRMVPITGARTVEVARLQFELAAVHARLPGRANEAERARESVRTYLAELGISPPWMR